MKRGFVSRPNGKTHTPPTAGVRAGAVIGVNLNLVVQGGADAVLSPHPRSKQPREYERWWYRERHLVECFINKIKHFRRIFSRFDTLARRYLGFVLLTMDLRSLSSSDVLSRAKSESYLGATGC